MPLYFAYGANLDVAEMARRCPRSKPLGRAKLMRHRLAIMREGWLTAARYPSGCVHGLLWDLNLADVAALDRFEDVADGLYTKASQPVIAESGPKRALVYFGANAGPGQADREYILGVIAAARRGELPQDGLRALERLAAEGGVTLGAEPSVAPRVRPRFATPLDRER